MMERKRRNRWLLTLCAALLLSAAAADASMRPERKLPDAESSVGRTSSSVPSAASSEASPASQAQDSSAVAAAVKPATMEYYDVPLASELQDLIFSECRFRNVPPDLVVALIGVESGYNPSMVSKTNDYGLMQINACHRDFFRKKLQITDLLDERQNIRAGVYMLSGIVGRYGNMNQALMVYNCGEAGAKRLWKQGVTSTAYSRKVIESVAELKE